MASFTTKIVVKSEDLVTLSEKIVKRRCQSWDELQMAVEVMVDVNDRTLQILDNDYNPTAFVPCENVYVVRLTRSPNTPGGVIEVPEREAVWADATAAFMDTPYIGNHPHQMTPALLMQYMNKCSLSTSAVAVGALTQSSGWGKSRLLKETCEMYRMPYISFESRRAVPKATGFALRYIQDIFGKTTCDQSVCQLQSLLAAFLAHTCRTACSLTGKAFFQFFEEAPPALNISDADPSAALAAAVTMYKQTFSVEYVLLLVDEAAWLLDKTRNSLDGLSAFRVFRRALRLQGITAVFASTHSSVQNFVPILHWENDDSLKEATVNAPAAADNQVTVQGICNVGPLDAYVKVPWQQGIALEEVFDPYRLSKYGRPLWYAIAKAAFNVDSVTLMRRLIGYAQLKLQVFPMVSGHLAAIFCIVNHAGMNPGRLADSMVKSHLATLKGISEDRSSLYNTYVSEPFIHMAALQAIHIQSAAIFDTFEKALCNGLAAPGYIGEIVARLALCLARVSNAACPESGVYQAISLSDYVLSLTGLKFLARANEYVSLTHWMPWKDTLTKECLFDAFLRTAAFTTSHSEKGVDLIIPVARLSEDGKVTPATMSAIFIEVKNQDGHCKAETLFTNIRSNRSFGVVDDPCCWIVQKTGQKTTFTKDIHELDLNFANLLPSTALESKERLLNSMLDIHIDAPSMTAGSKEIKDRSICWRDITSTGSPSSLYVGDGRRRRRLSTTD